MRNRVLRLFTVALLGLLFLPAFLTRVNADSIPVPNADYYVYDEAGVISESTRQTILTLSTELQYKTKAQIVVVVVNSLGGLDIETKALTILRTWGIGDQNLDNGVLILLAIDDRQSRIEVGYGLEGALNDAKTGRIQDNYMLPYYNAGDIDAGIRNGYLAILQEVSKEYDVSINGTDPVPYDTSYGFLSDLPSWVIIAGVILLVLFLGGLDLRFFDGMIFRLIFSILFSLGGSGGTFGGGGSGGGGGSSRKW